MDGDPDLDPLAGHDRLQAPRRRDDAHARDVAEPAEPEAPAADGHGAVGDPRRQCAAHAHARDRELEPRVGLVGEARGVQPDPALGVLAAPVVPDRRAPADHVDERTVEHDASARDPVRHRRLELGLGQRQPVERARPQVAQRRAAAGQRQLPFRHPAARPRLAAEAVRPGAGGRRKLGDRLLDRRRGAAPRGRTPCTTVRRFRRRRIDRAMARVTDPDRARRAAGLGVAGAQKPRLVSAGHRTHCAVRRTPYRAPRNAALLH